MIESLLELFQAARLKPGAEELADALWLAVQMRRAAAAALPAETTSDTHTAESVPPASKAQPVAEPTTDQSHYRETSLPTTPPVREPPLPQLHPGAGADLRPRTEELQPGVPGIPGIPFRSPAAPALPRSLDLGRALRPLMRRVPSRVNQHLDEDATVRRVAESRRQIWAPVLRAARERWLAVDLVIDSGTSMVIWQRTLDELRRLLEYQGAFRDVRSWSFNSDAATEPLVLRPLTANSDGPSRTADELLDPVGRRLMLLVSDWVGPAWHNGSLIPTLSRWAQHAPFAAIQVLPERLWPATALGTHLPVRLSASSAGLPAARLSTTLPAFWDEPVPKDAVAFPLLTLQPEALGTWARMLTGRAGVTVPGILLLPDLNTNDNYEPESFVTDLPDPRRMVMDFRAAASPPARRLAGYLAAVPLTLPVMRLVQRAMLPESGQIHLAEVFLSGLLRQDGPASDPELARYDWIDPLIPELLLDAVALPEAVAALQSVTAEVRGSLSALVELQAGQVLDFEAILDDPKAVSTIPADPRAAPFARASLRLLRRMGERYAHAAEQLAERFAITTPSWSSPKLTASHTLMPMTNSLPSKVQDATILPLGDIVTIQSDIDSNTNETSRELEINFYNNSWMVAREPELQVIREAINKSGSDTSIIFLEGESGIGKTRFLVEINNVCEAQEDLICTGVIDLYHIDYQQPATLMATVLRRIRKAASNRSAEDILFNQFLNAQEQFYSAKGEDVEDKRRTLEQAFLANYEAISHSHRVVLLFDTLEQFHPTIVEAEFFDFSRGSNFEIWLVNLIAQLPNSVIVLAGRPRVRQQRLFTDALGDKLQLVTMLPFSLAETKAFVSTVSPELQDSLFVEALHAVTGGRPVLLGIALACTQAGGLDLDAFPPNFQQYPESSKQLSDAFIGLIVSELHMRDPELALILTYAIYLRKGMSESLLKQILEDEHFSMDSANWGALLNKLTSLAFVKRRGTQEIFLHEEAYELLFDRVDPRMAVVCWRSAIKYINTKLEAIQLELRATLQDRNLSQSSVLRQRFQTLQIERLFYEMCIDVRRGYQNYCKLSTSAIAARNNDFGLHLQEEIAQFFDSTTTWGRLFRDRLNLSDLPWNRIVYDEGVRWAHRRINTATPAFGRNFAAVEAVKQVRMRFPDIYAQDVLARCHLDVIQLQAEVYTLENSSHAAHIDTNYERLVSELNQYIARIPHDNPDRDQCQFILANAYHYWGDFEQSQERSQSAIEKYRRTINLYRQLGPEVEELYAIALLNLGFALSQQGELEEGLRCVEASLAVAERNGAIYHTATALNTCAHIFIDLNQIEQALLSVQTAQAFFNELVNAHGLALCAYTEGQVRAKLAEALPHELAQNVEYERAIAAYSLAISFFDTNSANDSSSRIEIRVSLGRCYRDWSVAYGTVNTEHQARALDLLQEARALVTPLTPHLVHCTLLESIAEIFVDRGEFKRARTLLAEAAKLLPLIPHTLEHLNEEPEFREARLKWLRFADIEFQLMLCAFGEGKSEEAYNHMLRAFSGLIAFSPKTGRLDRFHALTHNALSTIGDKDSIQSFQKQMYITARRIGAPQVAVTLVDNLLSQFIKSQG